MIGRIRLALSVGGALALLPSRGVTQVLGAAECGRLAELRFSGTTVSSTEAVTGGTFAPRGATNPISGLPAFCRVTGVIAPTGDSQIRFEVWLPLRDWNGKFAGVGNGGWAGIFSYPQLAQQLRRNYATASTDTGHEGSGGPDAARFAFGHPERLIDFAHRAHHELAVTAKALVSAFYGQAPGRSYFIGCSSGGYEGLMEAQRYPGDYDGIVAGAPANNWTRLMAADFDASLAILRDSASYLPATALGLLYRGAVAACDALDGVIDGVLEDPRSCRFDPGVLQCRGDAPAGSCLTNAQVQAARRVYAGFKDPATGAQLYPGLAPGSEPFWPNRAPGTPFTIPHSHYKWLVFADSTWDWRTFDFADPADWEAHRRAEAAFGPILNATNPDLDGYRRRGGKLLQYHGWNDGLISAQNSIDYYESVVARVQGRDRAAAVSGVQGFYRLFMAPGVQHCGGGTGPAEFDMQTALEQWVEKGVAPDQVVATRSVAGVVERSRPLCAYPAVAVYLGSGDTNEATNFACRLPTGR